MAEPPPRVGADRPVAAGPAQSLAPFHSILWDGAEVPLEPKEIEPPAYFSDLNLDQLVGAITAGHDEYRLEPFFYGHLESEAAVGYRHQVFRDLQETAVAQDLRAFAKSMAQMRERLGQAAKMHYPYQRKRWFLDAVGVYCDAVAELAGRLREVALGSPGMRAFSEYLSAYAAGPPFQALRAETHQLEADLGQLTYTLHIRGSRITVGRYQEEADYSAEVEATFLKFSQHEPTDYRVAFSNWPDMNHIEAAVLDRVALLFRDVFNALDHFCVSRRDYADPAVLRFDREVHFYLAYLDQMARLEAAGLNFCYPEVSASSKAVLAESTFDMALAEKLVGESLPVVTNDFELQGAERVFVVTGPNQGGKTTFARTFGQLHHLAGIGCPVPGARAKLMLFDQLFTHFAREEDPEARRGKLEDEMVRVQAICRAASARSVVILNEIFTSTTLGDARFLGRKVLERVFELDVLCVYVTFVDELASLSPRVVSMVSSVDPENLARRTYKVVRRPADGLAYADAVAALHGLTYRRLRERLEQ
ncbi:MAG: MutS-related protein [Candidatus Dormibacteria bacterium]